MVKKFILAVLLGFFLLPAHAYSQNLSEMHISLSDGDVQINTADTQEWVAASINTPLMDGDRIWVPEGGRAEIQLSDGTYVRLIENTSLDVLTAERHSFQFYLDTGSAYVNFAGLRDNLIQIDTAVSSIRAYEKAKFGIDIVGEDSTRISVFRGVVYSENKNGNTAVSEGKILSVRGQSYAELSRLGPPDNWIRWNMDRDRALSRSSYSRKYLPDELSPYSYDFDRYGKWVYVRDYGDCWTPTVVVTAGWAPYRTGRWAWANNDYVWVSYEPWGWVPYHYGRWAFVASIGWCWVPPARGAVYWGPGFVGWVQTPSYVSWVPLAPGEIYYGHGYYGPHSVNITNININKVVIKKVYKNVYVNNAVSIESHDTFVTGRHVPVKLKENPFLREKISVGRPDIKPDKMTAMPIIREIPKKKLPPERIREIHVKELRERHPMIKERNGIPVKPKPSTKTTPPLKRTAPKEKEMEKQKRVIPSEKVPTEKSPARPRELNPPAGSVPEKQKRLAPSEKAAEKPKEIKPHASPAPEKQKRVVPSERVPEIPKEIKPPAERGMGNSSKEKSMQPPEVKPSREGYKPQKKQQLEGSA